MNVHLSRCCSGYEVLEAFKDAATFQEAPVMSNGRQANSTGANRFTAWVRNCEAIHPRA